MHDDPIVGLYPQDQLEEAARIIGPFGAAAQALNDASERRAKGENVTFYRTRSGCILVGPYCQEMVDLLT